LRVVARDKKDEFAYFAREKNETCASGGAWRAFEILKFEI